jgi:hypothetical protein
MFFKLNIRTNRCKVIKGESVYIAWVQAGIAWSAMKGQLLKSLSDLLFIS